MLEQRQYQGPRKVKKIISRKSLVPTDGSVPEMPDHDLEPPRFCRRALERLLNDWPAVNSMLNTGAKSGGGEREKGSAIYEDQAFLASQSGTALLDKFTHCLIVKCSDEMLDTLLTTLIRQLQTCSEACRDEVKATVQRFVRSVARLFVVLSVETPPSQNKKKAPEPLQKKKAPEPLQLCKRVFQALINVSIEELCETANSLLAPVRLGVARPTAPFVFPTGGTVDSMSAMDDIFNVDPVSRSENSSERGNRRRRRDEESRQVTYTFYIFNFLNGFV